MSSRVNKKVCQIVPRLSPAIDGVGDYAINLAFQLRLDFGIDTYFLVGDPAWVGSTEIEGFCVTKLFSRTAKSFANQLAEACHEMPILLHYVGYGYAKRGCPTWLVDGLQFWKNQNQYAHLVTMFHETSASGPIWTSAFWLSTLQISLAKRIVGISDRILTSKQLYAQILQKIVNQQKSSQSESKLPIPALPVFSNVGEPKTILPLDERDLTLVIFGGIAVRSRVYQRRWNELIHACEQLEIKKIIDIGPNNGLRLPNISNIEINVLGSKPALDVSYILASAFAGFIDYPVDFLGKSTIFASYCAHGILPIVVGTKGSDTDGLVVQKHYWFPDIACSSIDMSTAKEIASNAHNWYQSHNLKVQAKQFERSLFYSY